MIIGCPMYFSRNSIFPKSDNFLNVGSASHAEQTAKMMVEFEKVCLSISEIPFPMERSRIGAHQRRLAGRDDGTRNMVLYDQEQHRKADYYHRRNEHSGGNR